MIGELEAVSVLEKLKKELGIKKDKELTKLFRVNPNTLSTWKKRNTMDYKQLIAICLKHGISLEKLLNAPKPVKVIALNEYQ